MSSDEIRTIRSVIAQCIRMIRGSGDYEQACDDVASKLWFLDEWLVSQDPASVAVEDKRQIAQGKEVRLIDILLAIDELKYSLRSVERRLDALEQVPSNVIVGGIG